MPTAQAANDPNVNRTGDPSRLEMGASLYSDVRPSLTLLVLCIVSSMEKTGERRPGRVKRTKLTRERIIGEAKELLSEEGLDGISLRKLATRLGVRAPSLYWHFAEKSALLSAVLEETFNQTLDSVLDHREWQAWMRDFGRSMWEAECSTRDFGRLVTTTDIQADQMERIHARILNRLTALNLPLADAMQLQSSIQALITGWSAFACAPYGKTLGRTIDFESCVLRDLDTLIDGEMRRQESVATK